MKQVTLAQLKGVVSRINTLTGNNPEPWSRIDGKNVANVGTFYLDFAYGGVQLCQMINEGGGVRDALNTGHVPKRELLSAMFAFIEGWYSSEERCKLKTAA